ncbi:MAG TPA: di-heme-cytochrome C peroxidase [Allosphingosinicella sp.]
MTWGKRNLSARFAFAAAASLLALGACALPKPAKDPGPLPAVAGQNWSSEDKDDWWAGSQGSRLIPLAWLRALEAPDSEAPFMSRSYFDRFGYIWARPESELPIGFAVDIQSDRRFDVTRQRWFQGQKEKEPWVGLNCAACHTNRITYEGHDEIFEGAPALSDFQAFTDSLTRAMESTDADPAKFDRFARRVLAPGGEPGPNFELDKGMLAQALSNLLLHQQTLRRYNETEIVYGHGRLDAVGHILNKVAWLNHSPATVNQKFGAPQFRIEPDAPVSYPFIWNAHQHDFVQWNGLVPNQNLKIGKGNVDAGALVRNTSEVIGVFAEVRTRPYPGLKGYASSVRVDNLERMEKQLSRLMSPAWPEDWGKAWRLDRDLVDQGKGLFEQACASCHKPLERTDIATPIKAQMTPIWGHEGVETDPGMVCNTFTAEARGGFLTGTKDLVAAGDPLPSRARNAAYLKTQAIGVLLRQKKLLAGIVFRSFFGKEPPIEVDAVLQAAVIEAVADQPRSREQRLADCMAAAGSPRSDPGTLRTLAYKARPLNGVWATAPYLHNGSVRTLHDLLLPPAQRPRRFWVGNREFDPVAVGFVDRRPDSGFGSEFSTDDSNASPIRGNSNAGHDYKFFDRTLNPATGHPVGPRDFTPAERWALIEYMKQL